MFKAKKQNPTVKTEQCWKNRATVMFSEKMSRHNIAHESLPHLLRYRMQCEKIYTSLRRSTQAAFPLFSVSLALNVQEAYLQIV